MHLNSEPTHLDPRKGDSSVANYVLQNLHRNFYIYRDKEGLVPELAETCYWKKKYLRLHCRLRKDLRWHDGSPLTTEHFLATYQKLLDPEFASRKADWLFTLKNAREIYQKKLPISELGIKLLSPREMEFFFAEEDPEFIYKLANPVLSPSTSGEKFSGPYQLSEWKKGQYILLKNNTTFWDQGPNPRTDVKFFFVSDDSLALKMYEQGELDFLRRLLTLQIPRYREKKDFHWQPVLRFDYIGFGPALKDRPDLRRTLSSSLDYKEISRFFHSRGMFGCPGIGRKYRTSAGPCVEYVKSGSGKTKITAPNEGLVFSYSLQGGDDHRQLAEWLQSQWKKNLGWQVQVKGRENKIFLDELGKAPTAIFRRGNAPDWPTCASALEVFTTNHPENYIQLKSSEFDGWIQQMRRLDVAKGRKLCQKAVEFLIRENWIIPTGEYDLSILARPDSSRWTLNSLNQLDLR